MRDVAQGIYEELFDEFLRDALARHPELRTVFGKLDPEEEPTRYAAFVARVIEQALRLETDSATRLELCNQLIALIAGRERASHLAGRQLLPAEKSLLLEITPAHYARQGMPRPKTPLAESSLFTGSPKEPQLVHELQAEMRSADGVDILVSFIKWTGLRLLMPAFEELRGRNVPVRVITTSYMGASDATAVEWLARLPNVQVRVSYDTDRTRLHAKAYHFQRHSGFSTAYIGSANMSQAAITSGLEWNLKVTAQDMPHILEKFAAEFETYWNSREFVPFDPDQPEPLREAIRRASQRGTAIPTVFFDLRPHPFQERILDALEAERKAHGHWRNLVIAATGTGKTVVAAFDYRRFYEERRGQARLLFVAHRREILEQSVATFRNVLRRADFGELLVGPYQAERLDHLFCSVDMLRSRQLWQQVGADFYDYIVIDEAHHGTADSYRPIFDRFQPQILLGLTATPERMDGQSVAADFANRFAAEIRLPEALEEKLLCPFHYFGVADPVALDADHFWRNGRYDVQALENVYTGTHALAEQRLRVVTEALLRYEPDLSLVRGIGFCVSVEHARFMAERFTRQGIASAALVGATGNEQRTELLRDFREGRLTFIFACDVFNEGLDVPEVNTVLFLRPTESLTVFLQQLGRGLRHAPGKECLTVLDFVGQAHRRYRLDSKLKALLPKTRFAIDREVELDFPHLPAGCSIQLDRLARDVVLTNIRENLKNLKLQIPERLQTFEQEAKQPLTFGNFVRYHDYEPETLVVRETWSQWKARARLETPPNDPDLAQLKPALVRAAGMTGPREIVRLRRVLGQLRQSNVPGALAEAGEAALPIHYRLWGKPGSDRGIASLDESFSRLSANPSILKDLDEVLAWADDETRITGDLADLPFSCPLELHAQYGSVDILAALGMANLESAGQRGVGVVHCRELRAYVLLVTVQKTEREFSPSTMYADYPISRELLHWESQSNTTQASEAGQNLINHAQRGYTILVFARDVKKRNGVTVPFTYLGPAERVSFEGERPIKMVWRLRHAMPAEMFEGNRRGG
ncbi:helicase [Desulfuromonas versatilis]|uniref:Helicase n=1 Tax=Desulfuromonas versatilis TaxID=2802975 RepID=A0ABM8HRD9_9BACT|nr:DEAD/DEAH box helicase [Desulfuromonas versatilis]BCR04848.1 helicase [Desulfuromonas versatilis]